MGFGRPDPVPLRPPTAQDLRVLGWQLGRPPRGVLAVRPCPYGFPQVVLNQPLLPAEGAELTPMPTTFWLTCPFLVAEVAELESAGAVKRYEDLLAQDQALAQEYLRAHEEHQRERFSLLSPAEVELIQEKGFSSLLGTGIAGLANPLRVKCLHAQLAHFLARGQNPIGKRVAAELPGLFCPPDRVLCRAVGEPPPA